MNRKKFSLILSIALLTQLVMPSAISRAESLINPTTKSAINNTTGSAIDTVKGDTTSTNNKDIAFKVSSKTMNGIGSTYTLKIKNKVSTKKYTYYWSSSNPSIVTVTGKGIITAVSTGSAVIKCQIENNKTKEVYKSLSCKVKVRIPAESITISNAKTVNNMFTMKVGETYDFNKKMYPKTTSDKTFWSIENTNIADFKDIKKGIVTAKSVGTTVLKATAAKNLTKAAISTVSNSIIINVIDENTTIPTIPDIPTTPSAITSANIQDVLMSSATQLKITFDAPVSESTIINGDKTLKSGIRIVGLNGASDYGILTGSLSKDAKILTITSSKVFNGKYKVSTDETLTSTNGNKFTLFSREYDFLDNVKPEYIDTDVDSTGLISNIYFSEPINIDKLEVADFYMADGSVMSEMSKQLVSNKLNYKLSNDNTMLSIDLSGLYTVEAGKKIKVKLAGITDLVGNTTSPYPVEVEIFSDVTSKPQANLVKVERSSYYLITATYDAPIKTAGILHIGSSNLVGTVSPDNKYQVNYTLTANEIPLTGNQNISITGWSGYNVISGIETSAVKTISMDIVSQVPQLLTDKTVFRLENSNGITKYLLYLYYDTNVTLTNATGILNSKFYASNGDIIPSTNITYNATADKNCVILALDGSIVSNDGKFIITIPANFVKNEYLNSSQETVVNIDTKASASTPNGSALAGPKQIYQLPSDPSTIYVEFANKLDITSAQTITNYSIDGVTILNAEVVEQTDTKAVVALKILSGSIKYSIPYPITIKNIKGYNGTYTSMNEYSSFTSLCENVPPSLKNTTGTLLATDTTKIKLEFTEELSGKPNFEVYLGATQIPLAYENPIVISGNTIMITTATRITSTSGLYIKPTSDSLITDINNNKAQIAETIYIIG